MNNPDLFATPELLRMIEQGDALQEDFGYCALWGTLFTRWRQGVDLDCLVELLQSPRSEDRLRGAWYLEESMPPVHLMVNHAVSLAQDSIADCRWRAIAYLTNTDAYDAGTSRVMAECFVDLDLYVRVHSLIWASLAPSEIFADFRETILARSEEMPSKHTKWNPKSSLQYFQRRRAERGIHIA